MTKGAGQMTMVGRVARAIAYHLTDDMDAATAAARAAIAAMREPSDKMLDAVGVRYNRGNKKYFWQAMIDAALEEK